MEESVGRRRKEQKRGGREERRRMDGKEKEDDEGKKNKNESEGLTGVMEAGDGGNGVRKWMRESRREGKRWMDRERHRQDKEKKKTVRGREESWKHRWIVRRVKKGNWDEESRRQRRKII